MLAALAVAEFLGMTLWFSATAVTPVLVAEFGMSSTHASWLTIAVQAGFVVGTLASALANLADVLNARVVFFGGALVGAAANAAVLLVDSPTTVVVLRFLTGAALACVYPPGMKIAAGWFRERRGFALGILIGALTLGKAFPHLLSALFGGTWRGPMLLASALAVAGGVLVIAVVRDGPYVAATAPFDPHAIRRLVRIRGARLATLGYLGHMWELYAMWTWIAVLATASFSASGMASAAAAGSLAAFLAIGSGTAGLCARRLVRGPSRPRARRDLGDVDERGVRGTDRVRLRRTAGDCVPAGDGLGIRGGRRLGAIFRARQRILACRSHRHCVDTANLFGVPADDGHDRVAAASRGDRQLAIRVAPARARTAARDRRDDAFRGMNARIEETKT